MPLPTFIVIGAGRSGTTSLYHYLRQHPEIAMSRIKETRYFAWEVEQDRARDLPAATIDGFYPVRSLDAYRAQFAAAPDRAARGEASPRYLYVPGVPEAIAARLPDVRLVAILREPARRAYAQYMAFHRIGWDRRSFEQAIDEELERLDEPIAPATSPYLIHGLYSRHLTRFRRVFGHERMLVLLQDDLAAAPQACLRAILRFLGVDDTVPLDLAARHGPAGVARNALLERMMTNRATATLERWLPPAATAAIHRVTKPLRRANTARPEMPPAARDRLRAFYRDDVEALARLLDRDLSHWLKA